MDCKKILIEILKYYEKKVDEDLCTMEEISTVTKILEENMRVYGTLGDLSEFYGKSKDAVSGVIKRNLLAKPKKNMTLYPFHAFQKVIPKSWRKSR